MNRFGDQQATPNGFVAYNTDRRIIVVAHCGTNFQSLESIANDGEAAPVPVDESLRTSTTPQAALVHAGFQATWLRSRDDVLTGVRTALQVHPDYSVIAAGHSLGAAVSLLDGMYLRAQLPANVSMTVHPIEMPKTGNGAFADWVDATVRQRLSGLLIRQLGDSLHHLINRGDLAPHIPPFPFVNPSGEIWINNVNGSYESCPGQENIRACWAVDPR